MAGTVLLGLMIPFAGTALGAACVFVLRRSLRDGVQRALTGFAAGCDGGGQRVEPADPGHGPGGRPGRVGIFARGGRVLAGRRLFAAAGPPDPAPAPEQRLPGRPPLRAGPQRDADAGRHAAQYPRRDGRGRGVRGPAGGKHGRSRPRARRALSLGIAIQNFPEGAILSMPLHAEGPAPARGRLPAARCPAPWNRQPRRLTILAAGWLVPALPVLLSFAAGAMLYVVVEELIPEMSAGGHSHAGVLAFAAGFTLMMALDVALG